MPTIGKHYDLDTDGTLANNSDNTIASQKAVKTYADNLIPTQSGNSGKFLTTNGTTVSWASVDALPSQSGQSGKFLTTNGTSAPWSESTIWTYDATTKTLEIS